MLTMTGCWLFSMLSLTCNTQCIQSQSPVALFCTLAKSMQERSCSDCVTGIQSYVIIIVITYAHFKKKYIDTNYNVGRNFFLLRFIYHTGGPIPPSIEYIYHFEFRWEGEHRASRRFVRLYDIMVMTCAWRNILTQSVFALGLAHALPVQ